MPFPKTKSTPPPVTTAALLLLLVLLLLLDPIALCSQAAKPHRGFGHLGRPKQPTPPVVLLPDSPAVPPPPPATPWRHHVFLNFRGLDVRHTFSDHLYSALVRKEIKVFRDDRDLPHGENVTEALPRAIEESELSIVVLSRGYASSEYCLDELVKIMRTMKEKGHHPFPVFYQLSPNDVVEHQSSGCYKDDFDRHKRRYSYERVEAWSHALTSIADISGWVIASDRSEVEMVENIAKNMLWKVHELGREPSAMASGPSQSIRGFESTGKQRPKNLFICENERDDDCTVRICGSNGERNLSLENIDVYDGSSTTTAENLGFEGEPVVTRQPAASGDIERGPFRPADDSTRTDPSSEEIITNEHHHHHHHHQASEEAAGEAKEEDDEDEDQKRRLWTSRTCTNSNKKDDNHHHQTDQQQLKYIKPEMSPQGKKTVRIPKTVAQEEIKKFWDFSLIGQHLSSLSAAPHHQINTTTILHEANKLWKITSSNEGITNRWLEVKQVGTTKNGLYLFTFSDQTTRDRIVEASPWCIANTTFVMRKWQPNLQLYNLVQERASSIPVWVRLVGVPVEYMNAKGLSYIASGLGKPMYMDRATASKSQLAFAKVCVEMRLSEEGATTIVVALGGDGDDEDDNGVVEVVVRVFYQWRPCSCTSTSDCQGTAN